MFGGKSKKNGGNIDRIKNSKNNKNSKWHWPDLGESFDDEDDTYNSGEIYADEDYYVSEAYDTEAGYADEEYYVSEAYRSEAGYAGEEYYTGEACHTDYETDEDYREDEDYEEFDDEEGYGAEEYDDGGDYDDEEYDYDDRRGVRGFRGLIGRIRDKLTHLGAVDYIVVLTGLAVLIMAVITGFMYFNAQKTDGQVAAFADVGKQMEGITVIGERGLIAVADAELAKSLAAAQTPEADAAEENEGAEVEGTAENPVKVQMKLSSIQKDLKIKFANEASDKLIPNIAFEVQVTAPDGQESTMADDDKDGIIYRTDLAPGKYRVAMTESADAAYLINTDAVTITVKDTIEYKKVDVTDEIKKESQINVAAEDTKVNETAQESANVDTVEWVESTKTPIEGTESSSSRYEEMAKSNIPEPGKTAKADFSIPAPRFSGSDTAMSLAAAGSHSTLTAALAVAGRPAALTAFGETALALGMTEMEPVEPPVATTSPDDTDDGNDEPDENNEEENASAPEPTEEPEVSVAPTPTREPTPSGEPAPTPEPEPSAGIEPPTATPTRSPAATPQATPGEPPVATPSATPKASPTASPTATPKASPTATPKSAKNDTKSKLKDKAGKQVYIRKDDGSYAEAVYADYFKSGKFYQRINVTTAEYRYTGWQEIDGNTYFFDKNGVKVTGEQVIQGARYNFGSDGALSRSSGHLGIDVSKWNGTINWEAVKNSGVSYVIIRCGYRGSTNGALIEDPTFRANMKGASAAGLKVGVYFFTQAINEVEAVEEASAVLGFISGYNLSYPVFLDVEATAGNGRANGISRETRTAVCRAFCNTIQSSGYKAGIYANKTWLTNYIDTPALTQYKIWLAQYADKPSYTGTRYDMWQYSSKGSIGGISGNVDLNISYLGY